jgi:hypothetical protein
MASGGARRLGEKGSNSFDLVQPVLGELTGAPRSVAQTTNRFRANGWSPLNEEQLTSDWPFSDEQKGHFPKQERKQPTPTVGKCRDDDFPRKG